MPNRYFKIEQGGKLIYVDEEYGRFTYPLPKNGDPDLILETPDDVAEYLKERIQSPGWSYYDA